MKRLISILLPLFVLTACEVVSIFDGRETGKDLRGEGLVIEGWIDEGGYPVVSVMTTLIRPDEPRETKELMGIVVTDAEVSISDGTNEWALTNALSYDFQIPFVYSTRELRCEAGKSYRLSVRYEGKEATAVTTIPPKTELDSLEVEEMEGEEDRVFRIYASFTPSSECCYGFFSKGGNDQFGYTPVFLGFVDGAVSEDAQTVSITRGYGLTHIDNFKPGYEPGETVSIRFCTMDREIFSFWQMFEEVTGISYIMSYPTTFVNLPSNVYGAYGYWAGYGTTTYSVTLPEAD